MEKSKLGETAGRAELLFGPMLPVLRAERFSPLGKVELAEESGDPDIDGEGIPAPVGVEQHAPGNLGADAGELFQMLRGPLLGHDAGMSKSFGCLARILAVAARCLAR